MPTISGKLSGLVDDHDRGSTRVRQRASLDSAQVRSFPQPIRTPSFSALLRSEVGRRLVDKSHAAIIPA